MDIKKEINDILTILDATEYSETYSFLSMIASEEHGDIPSCYEIATGLCNCDTRISMHPVVFDFTVKLYEYEIKDDNTDAMNDLGALYYDGKGCNQSFEKAVFYYNMAAENGNRHAQENLGYCYYYGRLGEVDYKKAFHYFALGAFNGRLISLYKIGDMYQNGYYVSKNEAEAFNIYEKCIEMMTDDAASTVAGPVFLRLGNAFLNGSGTDADAKKALICYQNAERYLFDMVNNGEAMYKKSLKLSIEGQMKARRILLEDLPKIQWDHE